MRSPYLVRTNVGTLNHRVRGGHVLGLTPARRALHLAFLRQRRACHNVRDLVRMVLVPRTVQRLELCPVGAWYTLVGRWRGYVKNLLSYQRWY